MGLSITNNVMSLTAQSNLNRTTGMLSKSLERLSSGLKINRGADGPAALVISEQQRAQIAGLQTAINNTSKAASMVQTTEGALNEVNSLLVKIRSLALDSANSGVNDTTSLAANQAEVVNALASIDRIATNTQFGSKKLLDGTLGAIVAHDDVANVKIESQLTTGLNSVALADGDYKLKITTAFVPAADAVKATSTDTLTNTGGAAGTFFNTAAPGSEAASASTITVTAGAGTDFFNDDAGGAGADVDASLVVNASFFTDAGNLNVDGTNYAYTANTQVATVIAAVNADSGNDFTISLDDTTHQFTVTAKANGTADNGVQVTFNGTTNDGTLTATSLGVNDGSDVAVSDVTNNSFFTDSGSIVVGNNTYAYTSGVTIGSVLSTIRTNDARFDVSLDDLTHEFTVTAKTGGAVDNGVEVQVLGATHQGTLATTASGADATAKIDAAGEITDSAGASLANPILLTAKALSDGTVLENAALGIQFDVKNTAATTTGDKGIVYNVDTTGTGAIFQVGANAGQTATLSVASAKSVDLGTGISGNLFASLSLIDITSDAGAEDSIAVIDKAIGQISGQRADLGAFQQNTLESTANNLRSTLENTTAAESVIRDTDFAQETANFTKAQVLMQIGTTVLSNANQTSQLVLSLLK
jgi:flagellin